MCDLSALPRLLQGGHDQLLEAGFGQPSRNELPEFLTADGVFHPDAVLDFGNADLIAHCRIQEAVEVLGGTVLLILDDDLRHQRLFLGTRTARGGSAARLEHCRAFGACHVIGVGEQHIDMIGSQGCLFHQRNLAAGSGSNHGNLSGFGIRRCQRVPVVHIQDISVALQHRRHACKLFLRRIVDIRLHIDPGNVRLTQFPCGTDRQRSEKSDRAKHQHDS